MEMLDVMYELTNTKMALEMAEKTIRRQKGRLFGKNLVIAGLVWFTLKTCKMLGESEEKRKKAEEEASTARENCAKAELKVYELTNQESNDDAETTKDICCDGKASVSWKHN